MNLRRPFPHALAALAAVALAACADFSSAQETKPRTGDESKSPDEVPQPATRRGTPRLGVMVGASPRGGPVVLNVGPGSAADRAGIRVGDFVQKVGDTQVDKPRDLRNAIEAMEPGASTEVTVWRNGEVLTLNVDLREANGLPGGERLARQPWIGVLLVDAEESGAEVAEVYPQGPAAEAGTETGDRIVAVDGREVQSPGDAVERLRQTVPGKEVELKIVRGDEEKTLTVTVGSLEDFHQRVFGEGFRNKFGELQRFYGPDGNGLPELRFPEGQLDDEQLREMLQDMSRQLRELRQRLDERDGQRPRKGATPQT